MVNIEDMFEITGIKILPILIGDSEGNIYLDCRFDITIIGKPTKVKIAHIGEVLDYFAINYFKINHLPLIDSEGLVEYYRYKCEKILFNTIL